MDSQVEVEFVLPNEARANANATVYMRVEDVSQADAPARRVAEQVIHNFDLRRTLPYRATIRVPAELLNPAAEYNVRVHIDTRGDTRIGPGDCISTQSQPVLTHGRPNRVSVPLSVVR